MKRALLCFAVLTVALAMATTAHAWKKPPFGHVDKNKDGVIVFEEIVVFNSGLTMEIFAIIDLDKNGKIDTAEYAAMGKGGRTAKGKTDKPWWRCSSREGMMLYKQGTDLLVAGKNAEAAVLLRQAVATPLCVDYLSFAYYNLGIACMRLHDDAGARAALEKARALNVNNVVPENSFGLEGWPRKPGVVGK